jgi:signal transduction histidine kinase
MTKIDTTAVRAEPHFEIGTLLQQEAHAIVDRWCALARDEQRAAKRAHQVVLRDELPEFLELVGTSLTKHGASGRAPQNAAKAHGSQRWESGWSLSELVRDYQLLRLVVLEFLEEKLRRPLYYRETMAVGIFIDDAIEASIERYVTHREDALKRGEDERARMLIEASRRRDEFLAILGHELRNPLAPIRNSLAVIRAIVDSTHPAVATSLDVLDRQSRQLGRLVDDLLDLARISRGQFELRLSRIDVRDAIEQALETTRELVRARSQKLHVSLPAEPVYAIADPERVTQIAANLLSNASKYSDADNNVWLAVEAADGCAVIRVRDDGIGIAPEMLATVFELFARVDASPSVPREGLGIGLALVQRLVEQHGGTITAHSDGPGRGSEFAVRLPSEVETERMLVIRQMNVEKS